MTNKAGEEKKAPAKGSATLKAALLLLVLGIVVMAMGAQGGNLFILAAIVCAVVGGIQKRSAPN
jgi:hypothetical protein